MNNHVLAVTANTDQKEDRKQQENRITKTEDRNCNTSDTNEVLLKKKKKDTWYRISNWKVLTHRKKIKIRILN